MCLYAFVYVCICFYVLFLRLHTFVCVFMRYLCVVLRFYALFMYLYALVFVFDVFVMEDTGRTFFEFLQKPQGETPRSVYDDDCEYRVAEQEDRS